MLKPAIGAPVRRLGAWELWKWPALLFVVAFPLLAYYWGDWGRHWKGEIRALYGPASLEGVAVLLSHPVSADPLSGEGEVEWTLHLDPDSAASVDSVFLRYRVRDSGDARSDSSGGALVRLQAVRNRLWTGLLAPSALPTLAEDAIVHIEVSLHRKNGAQLRNGWPLGWLKAANPKSSLARKP